MKEVYKRPEFSASRLTLARMYRGITKKALAEQVGVTAQAITSYEDGKDSPRPEKSNIIAKALDFDLKFFYADDIDPIALDAISFRSRRSLTARVRYRTESCGEIAAEVVSPALSSRFRLPIADIPDHSGENPELAANLVRKYWELGQGPITNMMHLLEAKGIEIYWFKEESRFVDAVSFWRDKKPFILISLRRRGGERLRFDLAHELGHLVLHRYTEALDSQKIESDANKFASAFLLPDPQFRIECPMFPTLSQFLNLKTRWKTSVQAMIYRSRDMGLLSSWQYQRLFQQLSASWGRFTELGELAFEESAIQHQIFTRLAANGIYAEDFADEIHLKIDDLTNMIPAAEKYRKKKDDCQSYKYLTIEELGYPTHE